MTRAEGFDERDRDFLALLDGPDCTQLDDDVLGVESICRVWNTAIKSVILKFCIKLRSTNEKD